MMLVSFQLFLRQGKGLFTHQRRNGHSNPLRSRTFVICAITFRYAIPLTQRPRDALPRPLFGFSVTGFALVCRIAQDAPYRGSLPSCFPCSCWNSALIQQTCNRSDIEPLFGIHLEHHANHTGLAFQHFIVSKRQKCPSSSRSGIRTGLRKVYSL